MIFGGKIKDAFNNVFGGDYIKSAPGAEDIRRDMGGASVHSSPIFSEEEFPVRLLTDVTIGDTTNARSKRELGLPFVDDEKGRITDFNAGDRTFTFRKGLGGPDYQGANMAKVIGGDVVGVNKFGDVVLHVPKDVSLDDALNAAFDVAKNPWKY